MDEMLDDTMESLDDNEDELEEEAQAEVDKVLFQITDGKLGQAASKVGSLPVRSPSFHLDVSQSNSQFVAGCSDRRRCGSRRGDGTSYCLLTQHLTPFQPSSANLVALIPSLKSLCSRMMY